MGQAFARAAAEISAQRKTLCYNSVQQVYAESDVLFARHRSDLLIRIAFLFTSRPKYTAYQSLIFDLPVTGRQGFKTRIDHFPQYFVIHMASGKLGTIEQKQHPIIFRAETLNGYYRIRKTVLRTSYWIIDS
jgi:hypothetical protein